MKYLPVILLPLVLVSQVFGQGRERQVNIEANIVEVTQDFESELGFEFGAGPSISHFTNIANPSQINVVGYNVFGGIDYYANPILGIFSHLNITQFGNGFEFAGGSNVQKFTNIGIDAGIKVHVVPRVSKVNGFILANFDAGATTGGVVISRQNGDKDKDRFSLSGNDRKGYLGLGGGAGITVRTNVLDFSVQGSVTVGLLEVFKDNNSNTPRSVPVLAEIPVIVRFFGSKQKQQDRSNLLILIRPEIIDDPDD